METYHTNGRNGRNDEVFMEENNNYNKKFHDPWTRNQTSNMKETDMFISDDDKSRIYKPRESEGNFSTQPLTDSQRKLSVYHQEPHRGSASFAISVFNLMNAILGSGILGLAYAMAQLGMVLFFIFTIIVAFFALYAIHLLLVMCDMTGVKAYEKLGFKAFGLPGRITAACCILLQNIGAMSSYLFIVKYELPNVLMTLMGLTSNDGSWYLNGNYLVVLVTLVIIMPLATFKNIGFLGYTSGFSISCMFFFIGVVIAKKFAISCPLFDESFFKSLNSSSTNNVSQNDMNDIVDVVTSVATSVGEEISEFGTAAVALVASNMSQVTPSQEDLTRLHMEENAIELHEKYGPQVCEAQAFALTKRWAYSIPTMTFSFVCHTAVLPIYAELKHPSVNRMQKVANTSIGICFVVYSLSAVFGYLTFYNWMEAEMLLMYSHTGETDILTMIVRLTVLVAVILTLPLTHFPARKALTFLLFPNKDFQWKIHLGLMFFLLSFINLLVIFVPSIREVFGIIGATASTMLVFVLPCTFFIKLDPRPMKSPKKIFAAAMCITGIGLMIESLSVIIIGYFD
ncbi:putative sodium-coupled neutral amino acid transporter 6 [Clavelina lepadiformis]|uniref:Amino acid transporter transmembrane domain-containing protein n=1 Tax=Clavelina lepadiformis TaxID=159417 RepID=A0ABP0FJV8_CLALP